jgi:oligopeptide transport system substrate-binding protein
LAEAGYPNGQGFPTLEVIYNTNDRHKIIAEWTQQIWKNTLGINVTLQNMEWATFLDKRQKHDFEIGRAGWVADYQDPANFLELFVSGGGNNDGDYRNPEYDALIKKAGTLPGGPERNAVMTEAEEILMTRDQVVIPFFYYVSQNLIDLDTFSGWFINAQDIHPFVGMKRN